MRRTLRPWIALLLLPSLSACFAAVTGAVAETGVTAAEERSTGTKADDIGIYTAINRRFLEADVNDLLVNVTINVRHGRVLLTGNADKEATAQRAVAEAWKVNGVTEVINEININPHSGVFNNANDSLIKKNLEGRLFLTTDVWVINYSLDVVNGVAYLLGNVHDQGEMNRVLNVARTTRGVKKVVNYLRIDPNEETPGSTPPTAQSTPPAVPADAPARNY